MTQSDTSLGPEEATAIDLLVRLTLDADASLLTELKQAKEDTPHGLGIDPDVPDELETIRDQLKNAVRNVLSRQPGMPAPPSDWTALRSIAADFCDRDSAGVDGWRWIDAERWRQVCQQITDVASAEY